VLATVIAVSITRTTLGKKNGAATRDVVLALKP
jgi:hypothetical protein